MSASAQGQRGISLVELVVFIVIVSVGVVGLLSTMNSTLRFSADPMARKQMVAIAESLLQEALQQPFTYCDPDDANFLSATSTAACTGGAAASQDRGGGALNATTPAGETRGGANPLDNVADYGALVNVGVTDAAGGNAMAGYTATVTVARAGTAFGLPTNDAALQVDVTVQRAGQDPLTLTGYRFRYAPRN